MEAPLDRFRSSTWGWLRGTAAGLGTALLIVGGIVLALALPGGGVGFWPLLLTLVGLALLLAQWIRNLAAAYEFTGERLIVRRGIVFKSIDEIELYRVKDVRCDFSLLNQWADIGNLRVSSSDETTRGGDLVLRHVHRARDRREALRRLVDDARRKRGVREIDMAHDHF